VEKPLVQLSLGLSEGVEAPETVPTGFDEPRVSELAEVAGSGRLRNVQDLDQVTDAELAVPKDVQDAQSSPVRESLEERVDRFR